MSSPNKSTTMQTAEVTTSSNTCIKPNVVRRFFNRLFCKHEWSWVRNVYGDEIYMTGKFKRSWWKCCKCDKWQSREELHTDGRS